MISLRFLLCTGLSVAWLGSNAQDSTAPILEAFRISPSVVDVTDGPAEIELEFDITDDISGFDYARVDLSFEATNYIFGLNSASIVEGTVLDGTYRTTLTIPQGSPPGLRNFRIWLWDNADQKDIFEPAATVQVIANGAFDQEKPTIDSLTVEPRELDLSNGPQTATFTLEVSDDFSGITSLWANIIPTDRDSAIVDTRSWRFYDITEGSETATIEINVRMGAYAPEGEWQLVIDNMGDRALRASEYNNDADRILQDFDATFTVINTNGDSTPPELISVEFPEPVANTAFETSFLPWQVTFADDISGVDLVSVYVYSPSGGNQYIQSGFIYDQLNGLNRNGDTIEGILEVPQFILEGEHRVQVLLEDRANNRISFGHLSSNPLPPGSTEFITVEESAGTDVTDTFLTDLVISPETVDVTDGPQVVTMKIGFEDDLSGLKSLRLTIEDPQDERFESISLDTDDLLSGSPIQGYLQTSFEVPQFSQPGEYRITYANTIDQAGNFFTDTSFPVFPIHLTSAFTVINTGPIETEPPEILSVTMPQTDFTINEDRTSVFLTAIARDDHSGVSRIWIEYELPGDSESTLLFSMRAPADVIAEDGMTLTLEDFSTLREYDRPGTYVLDRVYVEDNYGLRRTYDVDDVANLPQGLPTELTVSTNRTPDTEPPQFQDIRLSTTNFDVTNGPAILEMEIDFTDDTTGLERFRFRIDHTEEIYGITLLSTWFDEGKLNLVSGDRTDGTLRQFIEIPQYIVPGTYELQYELEDRAFRDNDIDGEDSDFPFPGRGFITVTNAGSVDNTDPRLLDLVFDDPIDVTHGPASFTITADAIDDLSGISYLYLRADSPSGIDREVVVVEPQSLDYPSLTDIQIPVTVEIPAFAEPGEWLLEVNLEDSTNGRTSYDPIDLDRWGIPSSFTVINNQPPGYLWKGSDEVEPDGWRVVDWFGRVNDQGDYPLVYHTEHGWIFTSGSDLSQFVFFDFALGFWWWVDESVYPWMYAFVDDSTAGWYYYFAPSGSPGNRLFHNPISGESLNETVAFPR